MAWSGALVTKWDQQKQNSVCINPRKRCLLTGSEKLKSFKPSTRKGRGRGRGRGEERETIEMEMSLSEMVLDFLEELERGEERERNNEWESGDDDGEGSTSIRDAKQDKDFWQAQNKLLHVSFFVKIKHFSYHCQSHKKFHSMLQEALQKCSATENRIRMDTEEVTRKLKSGNSTCSCSNLILAIASCRNCMLSQITQLLRQAGYNSTFCKSKWRRSPEIPSGTC